MEELKLNFKFVDNIIPDKYVKTFNKYEHKPKKVQSQITNKIVHDLENCNSDSVVPHVFGIFGLIKISGKCCRDITQQ